MTSTFLGAVETVSDFSSWPFQSWGFIPLIVSHCNRCDPFSNSSAIPGLISSTKMSERANEDAPSKSRLTFLAAFSPIS
jgi:hypothetical protein